MALLGVLVWGQPVFAGGPVRVFVSIAPQKYFVQQIGRERVDVQVMVRPGASPATYEPRPMQMAALARASLYFSIGVPFEQAWLDRIVSANPRLRIVATDQGIEKLAMANHRHRDEDDADHHEDIKRNHMAAGHRGGRDPRGIRDPHIWLSPPLVKMQARNILAALQQIDPDHGAVYEANAEEFISEINALDADLRRLFSSRQGMRFMVFHPSWGYFAQAYGIQQIPIEMEGKNPKPAQLEKLIAHAREDGIRVVFVQPQFSTRSAALIAGEIGGSVSVADPLAENWAQNLKNVAMQFISPH
ncbi:MAG: zinc ABC transporter substrate-binding protein [Desulfobacterales bacterium]|nr:zinc ABC transporter substrate-binding protein [Desulfobacterales bacterium]